MQAIIFDVDHTIFNADRVLHEGVSELLAILKSLGLAIGAISSNDHRTLVRLDEAGVLGYFSGALCSDHGPDPKSAESLLKFLQKLGAEPHQAALVSHAHADILLGKDIGQLKTIGVSHGRQNIEPLREAGADHIVSNVPAILDVIE